MTPFVIDKNSWHYRMMNKCNSDSLWRCHDICAYVRAVMLTIVLLAFITTTVGGFIALTVGDTIAWIAACISLGAFVEFGIGPGIILVLTILITCLVGCYQFDEWRKRRSYAILVPLSWHTCRGKISIVQRLLSTTYRNSEPQMCSMYY